MILATCCWGLENNCTRKMSDKSTYEIVLLKGIFSGGGSFTIALLLGEKIPEMKYIAEVMLLGFVAYGLSIFLYIRAQRNLGAAKFFLCYSTICGIIFSLCSKWRKIGSRIFYRAGSDVARNCIRSI